MLFLLLIILFCLSIFLTFNPIYSVLNLILVYIMTAIFFFSMGLSFFPVLLIIIYVGAISVLFLFVIMMLNFKSLEFKTINFNIEVFTFLIFLFLFIFFFIKYNHFDYDYSDYYFDSNFLTLLDEEPEINALGLIIFNYFYIHLFIVVFILLVALIGVIALVSDSKQTEKRLSMIKFLINKYPYGK